MTKQGEAPSDSLELFAIRFSSVLTLTPVLLCYLLSLRIGESAMPLSGLMKCHYELWLCGKISTFAQMDFVEAICTFLRDLL